MKRSAPGSGADGDERQAALITAAGLSYPEQHRRRVRKYVVLMACRVPSLLLATAVYAAGGPGWVAAAIMGVTLPLSWMAVLIANDRPPREKRRPLLLRRRRRRPRGQRRGSRDEDSARLPTALPPVEVLLGNTGGAEPSPDFR
ncbi:DUF3099 domain-containing protein [Nocardia cyriacigeorgica]|uniref:DUF3099 domain-containing protein n=1 Tax=Nocardia cyriacigeorgica TaxID=135487 RepID=UPI0006879F6A|nr:DUF3099 domain-containing protein [Nocardia cyriacigeorgica]TLF54239.1 DUF3099 domain-containing protein [Nocardia cyriacigeorgica]